VWLAASGLRVDASSQLNATARAQGTGCWRVLAAGRPGQTMVEFALTSIVVVVMLFALLQISIIVVQQYGASQVARQTARWLAVRLDTIDADVVTQARTYATDLPGLGSTGMTSITVSPSCAALSGGKCTGRSSGDAVTITVTTSLTPVLFLPSSYGVAPYKINFPTAMPAIAYTVLLE
jgi:Flp pilus assembly protein TadG